MKLSAKFQWSSDYFVSRVNSAAPACGRNLKTCADSPARVIDREDVAKLPGGLSNRQQLATLVPVAVLWEPAA